MPPPMGMRGGGASHLGVPSYGRRASSASVMHPKMPPMNKKGSIPNLGKRGSTSSGGGISGLVINPPKIVKVRMYIVKNVTVSQFLAMTVDNLFL